MLRDAILLSVYKKDHYDIASVSNREKKKERKRMRKGRRVKERNRKRDMGAHGDADAWVRKSLTKKMRNIAKTWKNKEEEYKKKRSMHCAHALLYKHFQSV